MAKDRTRHARMRGRALEDRRRIDGAASLRSAMRAGRRCAEAMCDAACSLVDAMARGIDYIDWLLDLDGYAEGMAYGTRILTEWCKEHMEGKGGGQ